ncbi:calcyphosin-like protein isoform X1 [Mercenaria mercenaria]|uniref:calcyphosin-like protein isoform X1 n=1 Tax=Mercenaria mercenaria TaxID=6596 RepID=UPI00234E6CDC|nr:calcyphosin-like protein isoform X1 [Mercenaria mercenaria]
MYKQAQAENRRVLDLLEQLRNQCLLKGVGGLKSLAVFFRRMDTDFSKRLCYQELDEGMKAYGLEVEQNDVKMLFEAFDRDKNKQIDFLELIAKLRPPMTKLRIEVINQAFDVLDANKDGVLKLEDLKIVYSTNAKQHPKFISGEWTEEQVLRNFLDSIDTPGNPDGKVTREEFMNYYAGVSSTVDDDSYFDLMMRACYGLPNRGS